MLILQALSFGAFPTPVGAADGGADAAPTALVPGMRPFFIAQYLVHGVHVLTALEVETAVYPFLGPERTEADVRQACAALEAAYHNKGFGAAAVRYDSRVEPGGIVNLEVNEGTVERLRVRGARYFSPAAIKQSAPSLAEGQVINFNDVNHDIVGLNQERDRTVTPTLTPGAEPGTYDIDLNVKDQAPVHASADMNNYQTPNTVPLRVTGAVSDSNLWQSGNGVGASFEVAPQRREDDEVVTAYYLARFAALPRWSFLVQATKQDSNISTLGGATVAGPGETAELQATVVLPNGTSDWQTGKQWSNFSHSLSLSIDYKHFRQTLTTGSSSDAAVLVTPITYYPLTASYTADLTDLSGKGSDTSFTGGLTFNFRGLGSGPNVFDLNRYGADGSFIYFRGALSQLQPLPGDFQAFVRLQGQLANQPLVSSEEFSGGGETTVRGYLQSEEVGDDGAFATLELRSPRLLGHLGKSGPDWRIYAFGDAGRLTLLEPLPDQTAVFDLASVGVGSSVQLGDHVSGVCDAGYPLDSAAYTKAHDPRVTFQLGVNY